MPDVSISDLNERLKRLEAEVIGDDQIEYPDVSIDGSLLSASPGVDAEDDGAVVVDAATALNFASNLAVTDDGDGSATVAVSGISSEKVIGIPTTTLADGEYIATRLRVPDGETLELTAAGVQNDANSAPTDLDAVLYDETNSTALHTEGTKYNSGSLASIAGPVDLAFRTANDTGSSQNASSFFQYKFA